MLQELKKFPKEMQDAYKDIPTQPQADTKPIIMSMGGFNDDTSISAGFAVNIIVDSIDEKLLDLELDEKSGNKNIYVDFALLAVRKITGLTDLDTKKSKSLAVYDSHPKIRKLKAREFTKLGDLGNLSTQEKFEIITKFYEVSEDETFIRLSEWEKALFIDKVLSRQDTSLEKN